jgi:uncharacterized secreted protein with C-terminal beta-propeller domain
MNSTGQNPLFMEKVESLVAGHAVPLTFLGIGMSFIVVITVLALQANVSSYSGAAGGPFASSHELKKFSSYSEMSNFLSEVQAYFSKLYTHTDDEGMSRLIGPLGDMLGGVAETTTNRFVAPSVGSMPQQLSTENAENLALESADFDYSGTNVQVAGVDEADFLKNDGKYAYVLSGDKLTIVDAYPPEDAKVVSRVSLDIVQGQSLQNMFLNGDRLVVFYQDYGSPPAYDNRGSQPTGAYEPRTHMLIIDVSDRESPSILENYDVTGEYSNSRMIGDQIFLLTVGPVDYQRPAEPSVVDSSSSKIIANPDVYYFDYPQQNYAFNTITMLDLDQVGVVADGNNATGVEPPLVSKTFMIGAGTTVYVSDKNIYLAYQEYPEPIPVRQNGVEEILSPVEVVGSKTVIHKISIQSGSLFDYVGKGEVPGALLNQFSMDEQGDSDRFTVATTSEFSSARGFFMGNNVYRLDAKMAVVGKLEGIAEGESIYAARFVGDRLYLVTFRVIDPFFVVDLSRDQPEVLGELKLPGFSNYLHPYDGDHIVGIGREANEAGSQGGVKVALFDVSDVRNPKALDTYAIGSSQTDSEVLNDHRALLFDREKDILSIPISSYDGYYLDNAGNQDPLYRESAPWNGFYVFGMSPQDGIKLKGTIQHNESGDVGIDMPQGSRSFFIKDTLYTVTPGLIKMNDLDDVEIETNSIPLSGAENTIGLLGEGPE